MLALHHPRGFLAPVLLGAAVLCAGCGSSSSSNSSATATGAQPSGPHLTGPQAVVAGDLEQIVSDEKSANVAACEHVTLRFIQANLVERVHGGPALFAKCRSDVKANAATLGAAPSRTAVAIAGSTATVSVRSGSSCGTYTLLRQNGDWKLNAAGSAAC